MESQEYPVGLPVKTSRRLSGTIVDYDPVDRMYKVEFEKTQPVPGSGHMRAGALFWISASWFHAESLSPDTPRIRCERIRSLGPAADSP